MSSARMRGTAASSGAEQFSVTLLLTSTAAVVSLRGVVDLDAVPVCRQKLVAAVNARVGVVLVDLSDAAFRRESVALLGLMRRYLYRHGVWMALTEIPPQVEQVLERARVLTLYERVSADAVRSLMTGHGTGGRVRNLEPASLVTR